MIKASDLDWKISYPEGGGVSFDAWYGEGYHLHVHESRIEPTGEGYVNPDMTVTIIATSTLTARVEQKRWLMPARTIFEEKDLVGRSQHDAKRICLEILRRELSD